MKRYKDETIINVQTLNGQKFAIKHIKLCLTLPVISKKLRKKYFIERQLEGNMHISI